MKKKNQLKLEEEMRYHVQSWQQGKQSQLEYCRENKLAYHKFIYMKLGLKLKVDLSNGCQIPWIHNFPDSNIHSTKNQFRIVEFLPKMIFSMILIRCE